ncbi:MAG: STAS-like domain-containing protein [Armatimonadia bacterium]
MKISVKEQVGPNCLTIDDGEIIYQLLHGPLMAGEDVELDFGGVEVIASPFFNASVGQLLRDIPEHDLRARLHFEGLSIAGTHVLGRVIANSAEYYSNPDMRRTIDEILDGGGND